MTFKFNLEEPVYDKWSEEVAVVKQKRVENGHRCYTLDNGRIVHEDQLYKMTKKQTP